MTERPSQAAHIRAALGRNRLLHEVLNDDAAALRDAAVRQRCHDEIRAVKAARHRWMNVIAAAMVLVVISATVPFMVPSSPSKPDPAPHQAAVVPAISPASNGLVSIVRNPTTQGDGLVAIVSGHSSLITLPPSTRTSLITHIATPDATPSLQSITTAETRSGFQALNPQSPLVVVRTTRATFDFRVMGTADQHAPTQFISDDELLSFPGVVALYKIAPGQSRALFSPESSKRRFPSSPSNDKARF